jgi:hypothetical protein
MKKSVILILISVILFSCSRTSNKEDNSSSDETGDYVEYNNPPADGFNQEGSDLLATLLADKVMNAMGGRKAWDETRYISWTFFGRRNHVWDKQSGDVRIEDPQRDLVILMNINTMDGRVQLGGEELTNADSLSKYLDQGNRMWINDSYWLVMPYKLKDSGVTLYYLGEDTTQTGIKSDVIKLTFEDVGVTPENFYDVWIDIDTKLVMQWAYYPSNEYSEPNFITPWADYKKYGNILLSGNRGGNRELNNIKVLDELPAGTMDSFEPVVF